MLKLRPSSPQLPDSGEYFFELSWRQIGDEICRRHKINYCGLKRSAASENIVLFVDEAFVIKIFLPRRNMYSREVAALSLATAKRLRMPKILHCGKIEGRSYLVMKKLAGQPLRQPWRTVRRKHRIEILSELGAAIRRLHAGKVADAYHESGANQWGEFVTHQIQISAERQRIKGASKKWLDDLSQYLKDAVNLLPADASDVLLHGDLHPANLLLDQQDGRWRILGLVDFADSLIGFCEYDFVKPMLHMAFADRLLQRTLLLSYGYKEKQLDVQLRRRLMLLTILHEGSNLKKAALRLGTGADGLTLEQLEERIWPFL